MTHEEFIAEIEKMTVLELNDLVKALEEKFGVSAAAANAYHRCCGCARRCCWRCCR